MKQKYLDIATAKEIAKSIKQPISYIDADGNFQIDDYQFIDLEEFDSFSIEALKLLREFKYNSASFKLVSLEVEVAQELSLWKVGIFDFTLPKMKLESAKALMSNTNHSCIINIMELEELNAEVAHQLVKVVKFNPLSLEGYFSLNIDTSRALSQHNHELTLTLECSSIDVDCAREFANHLGYRLDIYSNFEFSDEVIKAFEANKNKNCRIVIADEGCLHKYILLSVDAEYHKDHQAHTKNEHYTSV